MKLQSDDDVKDETIGQEWSFSLIFSNYNISLSPAMALYAAQTATFLKQMCKQSLWYPVAHVEHIQSTRYPCSLHTYCLCCASMTETVLWWLVTCPGLDLLMATVEDLPPSALKRSFSLHTLSHPHSLLPAWRSLHKPPLTKGAAVTCNGKCCTA